MLGNRSSPMSSQSVRSVQLSPELNVPSGRFQTDFPRLCRARGMLYVPAVLLRSTPDTIQQVAPKKFKDQLPDKKLSLKRTGAMSRRKITTKDGLPKAALETDRHPSGASLESSSCSSVRKDPCILVEQAVDDNDSSVTTIVIRGWKVDVCTMEVLKQCWPVMPMLQTVQLWNVNLDADTLLLLASFLPQCARLTNLILDGNSLHHKPLACFIRDSLLTHLSLRFCQLTDQDVSIIASALGDTACNMRLQILNLSNNRIGDTGVTHLAEALRTNTILIALNLASNAVGDEGAAQIAIALSWFPVNGDFLSSRRRMIHGLLKMPDYAKQCDNSLPPSSARKMGTAQRQESKKKALQKGNCKSRKPEEVSRKNNVVINETEAIIEVPTVSPEPPKPVPFTPSWFQTGDTLVESYGSDPLLRAGIIHQEELWLPGNRTLASLNLSRNRIGDRGVQALLAAVDDQTIPLPESPRGLLRLVMYGNNFSKDSPQAQRLAHRIKLRDPFFLCPLLHLQRTNVSPCAMPVSVLI